jgi:hypothetical protein
MYHKIGLMILLLGGFSYGFAPKHLPGRPFSGKYSITRTWKLAGEQVATETHSGMIYRDALGRERNESTSVVEGKEWTIAGIKDPIEDVSYSLAVSAKVVWKQKLSDTIEIAELTMKGGHTYITMPSRFARENAEGVGEALISGLACDGFRGKDGDYDIEYWISKDLKETLLEKLKSKDMECTYRLYDVDLTEPDPSLFIVPGDYRWLPQVTEGAQANR